MSMTKKDFISLADHMRYVKGVMDERVTEQLLRFMQSQNPRFRKQLWLDYLNGKCGPSGGALKTHREWQCNPDGLLHLVEVNANGDFIRDTGKTKKSPIPFSV